MLETGDAGATAAAAQSGPGALTLALLVADIVVWATASAMLAGYGL